MIIVTPLTGGPSKVDVNVACSSMITIFIHLLLDWTNARLSLSQNHDNNLHSHILFDTMFDTGYTGYVSPAVEEPGPLSPLG